MARELACKKKLGTTLNYMVRNRMNNLIVAIALILSSFIIGLFLYFRPTEWESCYKKVHEIRGEQAIAWCRGAVN